MSSFFILKISSNLYITVYVILLTDKQTNSDDYISYHFSIKKTHRKCAETEKPEMQYNKIAETEDTDVNWPSSGRDWP